MDGDGDRLIMIDHKGELVDGDELLYIIACARKDHPDFQPSVVGTVMSNLGLERALESMGMEFYRAQVGDRHVMELLKQHDSTLGGESSGHIICLDRTSTGDGVVSALQVLSAIVETGSSLHELKSGMEKFPQTMVNVRTEQRFDFENSSFVTEARQDVDSRLGDKGRILLRASGTEPVIRVMVEGQDPQLVAECAHYLAQAVENAYAQGRDSSNVATA